MASIQKFPEQDFEWITAEELTEDRWIAFLQHPFKTDPYSKGPAFYEAFPIYRIDRMEEIILCTIMVFHGTISSEKKVSRVGAPQPYDPPYETEILFVDLDKTPPEAMVGFHFTHGQRVYTLKREVVKPDDSEIE